MRSRFGEGSGGPLITMCTASPSLAPAAAVPVVATGERNVTRRPGEPGQRHEAVEKVNRFVEPVDEVGGDHHERGEPRRPATTEERRGCEGDAP
jgi:hypothetical protein